MILILRFSLNLGVEGGPNTLDDIRKHVSEGGASDEWTGVEGLISK